MEGIVDLLNATYAKVADVKEGVEAKIEEPVKVVDDKIDTLVRGTGRDGRERERERRENG
jgi:hypothetical protein